jgi:Tol biopolymer transport system component
MRPTARATFAPPSTRTSSHVLRAVALVLLAGIVAGGGFAIGLRAGSGQQPDPSGALRTLVERSGSAVVYSEFGDSVDTIWAADPADPTQRVEIGAAPHMAGYGVFPSLSPDGKYVAYTLANGAAADLWLLDIASGTTRRLATGVDVHGTPVWSQASDSVVVRRGGSSAEDAPVSSELVRVDLSGNISTVASEAAGLYPIGYAPDGALYYAGLSSAGTDLERAGAKIAHLSDGIARDFALSSDGSRLAYVASGGAAGMAVNVIDLGAGAAGASTSAGPGFHPVFAPDGSLTVGRLGGVNGGVAGASATTSGFDIPLSWSPDGSYLVVRHFENASTADPGPSWLWAVAANGERRRLSDISDVAIAGWLTEGASTSQ